MIRAFLRRLLLVLILSASCLHAATNPLVAPVPVPSSPYLPRIYKYVDAMLEDPVCKTNLHHHQNWLRLFYTLSELSAKPKYRDAADGALRRWLEDIPAKNQPITRPWLLWDRCFQIAPAPSTRFALAVVTNQITNHPGFFLRTCAAGYAHTTNEVLLRPIESFEPAPSVSLAIDCDGVARGLPEPIASRLRAFVQQTDASFRATTESQAAMMYVSRYENTGKTVYRDAIRASANEHLRLSPGGPPLTMGHIISLQLAAWRSTARQQYLDEARAFADVALIKYFDGAPSLDPGLDTLALSLVELHLHVLYITAVRCPPNTLDR